MTAYGYSLVWEDQYTDTVMKSGHVQTMLNSYSILLAFHLLQDHFTEVKLIDYFFPEVQCCFFTESASKLYTVILTLYPESK